MDSEAKTKWNNGKPLREQARTIVFNVAMFIKVQKLKYNLNYDILESTSAATGVSIGVIKEILREHKQLLADKHATASSDQSDTRKEELERTAIKEEMNIKQEQTNDYGIHPCDTNFVAVKVESEFSKAEMKNGEAIKQESCSQLDENRVWNTKFAEASSDTAECKIMKTTPEIVSKCEDDVSDDSPSIQCYVCGKIFSCNNRLISHRRMHFRVIKCDACGKSYKILRSAKLSTGEEMHVCKASEKHHMQRHHLNGNKESDLKTLQKHVVNKKCHKCEFCEKCYKYEHDLKLHAFAHGSRNIP